MTDTQLRVVVEQEDDGPDGWHEIARYDDIVKWRYAETPYRVVCICDPDRGHWKAIFTTDFNGATNKLIKGNLGGGELGRQKAISAAESFIDTNQYGCAPPGEISL